MQREQSLFFLYVWYLVIDLMIYLSLLFLKLNKTNSLILALILILIFN